MDSSLLICGASLAIILLAPWFSSHGVNFSGVGNIIVRLVLVGAILAAIYTGPLEGILVLLAVVTLLIERNHQILSRFPTQQPPSLRVENVGVFGQPYSQPIQREVVKYEPVQESETLGLNDSNPRLPEGPNNQDAVSFFKAKGLV